MEITELINKVHLADSNQFIKTIPDDSIDCIYTDVPYLFKMSKATKGSMNSKNRVTRNAARRSKVLMENDLCEGFDYSILDEFVRVLKNVNIFIWVSEGQISSILNYFKDYTVRVLVWCKTNPIPITNGCWLPDVEYCLYIKDKEIKLNKGYELKSKHHLSPINKKDKDLYSHPTIKPLDLVMRHLQHATDPGDIILDPFIGSGTTGVACNETNRNYIGIEKNPEYFDIAVKRLNGITADNQTSIFTNFNFNNA